MVWLSQVLMRRFLFQFLDMITMITTIMMIDCNGNSNIMLLRMKSKPPLCFQIIWVGWLNAQGKEVKALFANPDFDVFSSLPSLLNIWLYLYHICCLLLASAIFAFQDEEEGGDEGIEPEDYIESVQEVCILCVLNPCKSYSKLSQASNSTCFYPFVHSVFFFHGQGSKNDFQGPAGSCSRCWESGALLINKTRSRDGEVTKLVVFMMADGWLFIGNQRQVSEKSGGTFIYPDFHTALVGEFTEGNIIAREV